MDTNETEETPAIIATDAESQEFGALHGQTIEGENTGTSAPDASDAQTSEEGESDSDGTGARAGSYT